MKNILLIASYIAIVAMVLACRQDEPREIDIDTTITDAEGVSVKEVNAGMTLRLTSEFSGTLTSKVSFSRVDRFWLMVFQQKSNKRMMTLYCWTSRFYTIQSTVIFQCGSFTEEMFTDYVAPVCFIAQR
jgi:hypothetical protein